MSLDYTEVLTGQRKANKPHGKVVAPGEARKCGAQRLSPRELHAWESLGYGMFLTFGMSTFDGDEVSKGDKPSGLYAPDKLDVDQWISVVRDAGMTYAVLTAKHVSGHCLWPSKHNDYHVGTSGNKTDVVEAFVRTCAKRHIKPGLYYCCWDNHNTFGSLTPTFARWEHPYTTQAYREFQLAQMEELLTQYGPLAEVWIDIPIVLGHEGRRVQYEQIARLQPQAAIMMNHGITDGSKLLADKVWPTDLMALERFLPASIRGYNPWFQIGEGTDAKRDYYLPAEVCDTIGYQWFHVDDDAPRSEAELLGMYLVCRARKANFLLNVPPDRAGRIAKWSVDALMRLRSNIDNSPVPFSFDRR